MAGGVGEREKKRKKRKFKRIGNQYHFEALKIFKYMKRYTTFRDEKSQY